MSRKDFPPEMVEIQRNKLRLLRAIRKPKTIALLIATLALALTCAAQPVGDDQWTPPTELFSPDKNYCVKMVTGEDEDHRALVVLSRGRTLAQFPTTVT